MVKVNGFHDHRSVCSNDSAAYSASFEWKTRFQLVKQSNDLYFNFNTSSYISGILNGQETNWKFTNKILKYSPKLIRQNSSLELSNTESHLGSVNFFLFNWNPAIPRTIQASINIRPPTGVK